MDIKGSLCFQVSTLFMLEPKQSGFSHKGLLFPQHCTFIYSAFQLSVLPPSASLNPILQDELPNHSIQKALPDSAIYTDLSVCSIFYFALCSLCAVLLLHLLETRVNCMGLRHGEDFMGFHMGNPEPICELPDHHRL